MSEVVRVIEHAVRGSNKGTELGQVIPWFAWFARSHLRAAQAHDRCHFSHQGQFS